MTITTLPWRSSVEMRSGWMSVMRARVNARVERMPAWRAGQRHGRLVQVVQRHGHQRGADRLARGQQQVHLALVGSRSRPGRPARSVRRWCRPWPRRRRRPGGRVAAVRATRRAAARMRSAVASDEPPYFWTINPASSGDDMRSPIGQRQRAGRRPRRSVGARRSSNAAATRVERWSSVAHRARTDGPAPEMKAPERTGLHALCPEA